MTRPLLGNLEKLGPRLRSAPPPTILLDFDGTLAPIAADPADARMPAETLSLLKALIRHRCLVGVISGRSLDQLRILVPAPGLILAGNHGMEIEGDGWRFLHEDARAEVPRIERAVETLRPIVAKHPGALVENKGLTASLHYRKVSSRLAPLLLEQARGALEKQPELSRLLLVPGRRVLEIRPDVSWDKGRACVLILERTGCRQDRTVYIGDDRTDEDAFRRLPDAITVRVGLGNTAARYYVEGVDEVTRFLKWLAEENKPI